MFNFSFLRPKEKFLILGISPKKTRGLLLSLDAERNLKPEKFWDNFPFLKLMSRRAKNLDKKKLIVSADPELARTVSFPIEVTRDANNFREPLTLLELENLLAQAIGKVFNHYRLEASSKLGTHEIDTILVNSTADNFKVDGHLVLNPVSFITKKIQAILGLTFTTRQIFDNLKPLFNSKYGFFFTEFSRAGLNILSKIQSLPVSLMFMDREETNSYTLEKAAWGAQIYREEFNWPLDSLFASICENLAVSSVVAHKLYKTYIRGDASESFRRSFFRLMRPSLDNLETAIRGSRLKGTTYLHSPEPLPLSLPIRYGRAVVCGLSLADVLDKSGFKINLRDWPMPEHEIFMSLAPFFEFYEDKSNLEINQKLRRRLHWLIQG